MTELTILATKIHQLDGLYSLNDFHKAAGNEARHRPNQFLRIKQTQELIAELETAQICAVKPTEGKRGGTYACRELVIAYAAWISAVFHLKVIRVFLNQQTQPTEEEVMLKQLRYSRWMLTFGETGAPYIHRIPEESCVMSIEQLLKAINERNGLDIDPEMLFSFVQATIKRLEQNYQYQKAKAEGKQP